jgi:MFS superfamily sulfate permease-like transporter
MHPREWGWKWILWQVAAPLLGPIIVSLLVVLAWHTGKPGFRMQWSIVLDVSPWALTFYAMTLIGATMNDFWPKMQGHAVLGISLFTVATAVALYASFIVVWRHDPDFKVGTPVYGVTLFLLFLSIVLCHQAAKA